MQKDIVAKINDLTVNVGKLKQLVTTYPDAIWDKAHPVVEDYEVKIYLWDHLGSTRFERAAFATKLAPAVDWQRRYSGGEEYWFALVCGVNVRLGDMSEIAPRLPEGPVFYKDPQAEATMAENAESLAKEEHA